MWLLLESCVYRTLSRVSLLLCVWFLHALSLPRSTWHTRVWEWSRAWTVRHSLPPACACDTGPALTTEVLRGSCQTSQHAGGRWVLAQPILAGCEVSFKGASAGLPSGPALNRREVDANPGNLPTSCEANRTPLHAPARPHAAPQPGPAGTPSQNPTPQPCARRAI